MEKFNCDCGFSWLKGFSGQHNCSPYYRETIEAQKSSIERYQKLVCQTCDGHGAVGNILDSMDCPDCLAYENPIKAQAITDAIFNSEQIDIDGHKYVCLEDLEVNIKQLGEAK